MHLTLPGKALALISGRSSCSWEIVNFVSFVAFRFMMVACPPTGLALSVTYWTC